MYLDSILPQFFFPVWLALLGVEQSQAIATPIMTQIYDGIRRHQVRMGQVVTEDSPKIPS